MKVLCTGALGLVGSEACKYYLDRGHEVVGVDNNMRKHFFGDGGCGIKNMIEHQNYIHTSIDISNGNVDGLFQHEPDVVIHCAAQPSHDWAAKDPLLDFRINALGTLKLLEACRKYSPDAVFVYMSTNKVYGDNPNKIELKVEKKRFVPVEYYENGIDETMDIDDCTHSLFGVSKLSGDLLVQEYGRYFGMKTGLFRCGCITGSQHSGVELHGFLSYLVKCHKEKKVYNIYGYHGYQVRDNIHAFDLVTAIDEFVKNPKCGAVYNMGGGTHSNISVLEAVGKLKLGYEYVDQARTGDHKWYISNVEKFQTDYPNWKYTYDIDRIFDDLLRSDNRSYVS